MITYRRLPESEWDRLKGHPSTPDHLLDLGPNAFPIVGEDEDGIFRFVWWALTAVHLEGGWKDPNYTDGLGRGPMRMLDTMCQELDTCKIPAVYCFAPTPEIASILDRLGFTFQPYQTFLLCPYSHLSRRSSAELPALALDS